MLTLGGISNPKIISSKGRMDAPQPCSWILILQIWRSMGFLETQFSKMEILKIPTLPYLPFDIKFQCQPYPLPLITYHCKIGITFIT